MEHERGVPSGTARRIRMSFVAGSLGVECQTEEEQRTEKRSWESASLQGKSPSVTHKGK